MDQPMIDFLIVGGGISGLFIGMLLERNNYSCKILERDQTLDSRKQGFSLTMQEPIKNIFNEYGLLKEMMDLGKQSNQKIFCKSCGDIMRQSNIDKFNCPVPRQSLRKIFSSKLKEHTLEFNKRVNLIENFDQYISINCDDGSNYKCKVLIAADGVNSTIRNHFLPDIKLTKFNVKNTYGLFDLNMLHQKDYQFIKNNTIQILDGSARLFSKPYNDDYQMWELTIRTDDGENSIEPETAFNDCLSIVKQWINPTPYYAMLQTDPTSIITHSLFDYVPKHSDLESLPKNVVFIGDSIHPMAPTIGMGANEALVDCYEFITELNKNTDYNTAIENYHQKMVDRTSLTVKASRDHMDFYHSYETLDPHKLADFKKW